MRRASAAAFLLGLTLIIVGAISSATPVTVLGALVTAATVATLGLCATRGGARQSAVAKPEEADDGTRPEKHLEGMNFRLTDSWDIWEH